MRGAEVDRGALLTSALPGVPPGVIVPLDDQLDPRHAPQVHDHARAVEQLKPPLDQQSLVVGGHALHGDVAIGDALPLDHDPQVVQPLRVEYEP